MLLSIDQLLSQGGRVGVEEVELLGQVGARLGPDELLAHGGDVVAAPTPEAELLSQVGVLPGSDELLAHLGDGDIADPAPYLELLAQAGKLLGLHQLLAEREHV